MKNRFKEQFANLAAPAFQKLYPEQYAQTGDKQVFASDFIYDNLEQPKDASMGRFAFPVFRYGKLLGSKPPEIAQKISETINQLAESLSDQLISTSFIAGFINVSVNFQAEASEVISSIIKAGNNYADSELGKNKKMLVEYSAPNIAKPFGIGHIRTTILGNCLRRIFIKLGYETVGINYLGDWGTQFGKMISAYKKWADDSIKGKETVSDLLELYVKFHEEAEKNPDLEDEARLEFKKLEQGDAENQKLWEEFRKISLDEFERVYQKIGVEFDWVTGEAFLNDKMESVINRIDKAGLVSQSEGATIVDLHDDQLPPALLKKADSATLYLTRDIAGYLYRFDKYHFDEMLYVVAINQSVHFQQMFKTLELLEEAENLTGDEATSKRGKHIEFGMIKFKDQMLSTRRGHIIYLEDVIDKAADLAKERISAKNPELNKIDETSLMIGLGALIFSQLSVRRQKDVNFDWDEVLSFEGETGPYLQYTHARLCSLLRNYPKALSAEVDYALLDKPEEKRVIELLADFPQIIEDSARNYDPYFISAHLIKLASAFNKFYQRKDENGKTDKIISDNEPLTRARIALVESVRTLINEGLRLLGIQAPEEM